MDADAFVREYLLLGLAFDRLEEGFVDAYTGDPALRRQVENAPPPDPRELARRAANCSREAAVVRPARRACSEFLDVHLRALRVFGAQARPATRSASSTRSRPTSTSSIEPGDPDDYREAHRLDGSGAGRRDRSRGYRSGSLAERIRAHRAADEIPPERLADCVDAFSSALRDRVRADTRCPRPSGSSYEVVGDKPWSGFNYYLGDYRSKVAINSDLKQHMAHLPHLIAHESYPGHHTEHCRKEAGLVRGGGQAEQTLFVVNTPQCLMAEGLADLALESSSDRAGVCGRRRSTRTSVCGSTASAPRRCRPRRRSCSECVRTPR